MKPSCGEGGARGDERELDACAAGLRDVEYGLCLTDTQLERLRRSAPGDFTPEQRARADAARAWLDAHTTPRDDRGAP